MKQKTKNKYKPLNNHLRFIHGSFILTRDNDLSFYSTLMALLKNFIFIPGSCILTPSSSMLLKCCSLGACITKMVDPRRHIKQPSLPRRFSFSSKKRDASTALKHSSHDQINSHFYQKQL